MQKISGILATTLMHKVTLPQALAALPPKFYSVLLLILLAVLVLQTGTPAPYPAQAAGKSQDQQIEQIFAMLTPAERVGQLFLVSFKGNDLGNDAAIAELITRYRVGGVVILAVNQNFTNNAGTPAEVLALTNALQRLAQAEPDAAALEIPSGLDGVREVAAPGITSTIVSSVLPVNQTGFTPLPLFIAVSQEGDGYPYSQIRGGMAELPNSMALGATWNDDYVRQVGQVTGQRLALLGVNMVFGPSLDVLDNPRPERGVSLGTRAFGGHPYWVGKLGQAYIEGVHQGSNNQVLTIAKHFPGFGSSDRKINLGVPTILKSLDDLRRTELPPFFKVTKIDADPQAKRVGVSDGLMTAHVRYQGLPGNLPISLDARNLPTLLALKELAPWREAGGLIVSAPLGAPAALEGIVGAEQFPARRLAQDAFLGGNDVLLLQDFAFEKASQNEFVNIISAIEFFQEKYTTDPNFQAAVDRSVRRIIKAKLKVFGQAMLQNRVENPVDNLAALQAITIDLDQIAQAGVTLVTPLTQEGLPPLSALPQPGDKILIFTDDRPVQDCPTCPQFSLIETTALQNTILQLFGPNATGQILPEQITSFSFADLEPVAVSGADVIGVPLSTPLPPPNPDVEAAIQSANWVIFAMLNVDEAYPQSAAVRLLLRNRYDLLRNKNLILFAFNAPYFLDETEISQLNAYYTFYSRGQAYIRSAARLLFQQFQPAGASPVGIPAIGPLNLSPDPNQTIQLEPVDKIDAQGSHTLLEPQSAPVTTLDLKVGEGILFRTDTIVDRFGHPVPDGTLVDFFRFYPLEGLSLEPLTASTVNGIAEITIVKERDTPLQVRASSNLAVQAVPFNIGPGIIETPTPTITPRPTNTPVPTTTPEPTVSPTPTTEITATLDVPAPLPTDLPFGAGPAKLLQSKPVDMLDLIYTVIGILLIGGIGFSLGGDRFSLEERVRPALVAIALGLVGYIGYIFMAMAFPKSGFWGDIIQQGMVGHWVAPLISLLGAIVGVVAWYLKPGRIFWVSDEAAEEGVEPEALE